MPRLKCSCGSEFDFSEQDLRTMAGQPFTCSRCGKTRKMPPGKATVFVPASVPTSNANLGTADHNKKCPFCAEPIAFHAIKCKHCGSMLVPIPPAPSTVAARVSTTGIAVPLLISAIGNIVIGLAWLSTCFGVIFAVPMFVLCGFEFALYGKANRVSPHELVSSAKTLAVFEIIVGLANLVSFICGIILLINAGKVTESQRP